MPDIVAIAPPRENEPPAPQVAEAAPPAPTPPAPTAPDAPAETIVGTEAESGAVLRSARPTRRPPDLEVARTDAEPPPRGNAEASARAGTAAGERAAPAASTGRQAAPSSEAGNAARSEYPGEVMRRLSRIRRPSVRAQGTATVAFSVAGSGGLASVGIARSSGSASLDGEALRLVQRAAPFPPPPPGAQTSFTIDVAGR